MGCYSPSRFTHLKYHHYRGTTYHRFRALNAPNYEHSTHKTNTTNSELVCSLVSIRRFVPLWVLFVPSSCIKNDAALLIPDLQQVGISGFHVRYQVLSILPPFCQFVELSRWNSSWICFGGAKYTLPSLLHGSQGKVSVTQKLKIAIRVENNNNR